mmetsp:Transcript_1459/g.3362  ORF Transcript_1459/g.3362 Transcript_1459/m.3362 type:complete len:89 (+) Transcript_1459:224-490(+)
MIVAYFLDASFLDVSKTKDRLHFMAGGIGDADKAHSKFPSVSGQSKEEHLYGMLCHTTKIALRYERSGSHLYLSSFLLNHVKPSTGNG